MVNKNPNREQYIDELKDYSKLQGKNIVAIDPSKMDLLFCVDTINYRSKSIQI